MSFLLGEVGISIGIYSILNTINNKIYIGSSINTSRRWSEHKLLLRKNKHYNNILQNSWNKYGSHAFVFEVLEQTSLENLISREQFYIDSLKPYIREKGYNICKIAGELLPRRGEEISHSKLNAFQVKNIRLICRDYLNVLTFSEIGALFKVGKHCIYDVYNNRSWSHILIDNDSIIDDSYKMLCEELISSRVYKKNISVEEVIEVKKLLRDSKLTHNEIAKTIGCSESLVSHIKNKRKYANIKIDNEDLIQEKEVNNKTKLKEEDVREIKMMLNSKVTIKEIANIFNVSSSSIYDIKSKRTWKNIS